MDENGVKPTNYSFGDIHLDPEGKIVTSSGQEIHLARRPFEVLTFLVVNHDRVVSRKELLDKFWDGHDVYDDALRKCVGSIRKALKDEDKPPRFIETRYGGGYRFVAGVQELDKNGNGWPNGISANLDLAAEGTGAFNASRLDYKNRFSGRLSVMIIAAAAILLLTLGFYFFVPRQQTTAPRIALDTSAMRIYSIAVMPLKNLTGDANSDYFSDGITESIITELSRVSELRIVSRGSTFSLQGKEIDPREVGKRLKVDALLEGSIQKKGDLLTIGVRLISTQDGSVLWTSPDFERPVAAAYELQDTISRNIAVALRTELSESASSRNTTNADAYQAYLKGRFHWNKRSADGIRKSIEFYEQAIAFDPSYSLAYSGLAESYVQGIWHVPFDGLEVLPKAEAASLKAIELDESSSEAHTALAGVYSLRWNWEAAGDELQRAIELNPRNARAYHVQAFYFMLMGRYDESVLSIEKALELDPLNMVVNTDYATLLFIAKRTDEAFQQWKKTVELDPSFALAHLQMANTHMVLGNEAAAISELIKEKELSEKSPAKLSSFREMLAKDGINGFYKNTLRDLTLREARGERISPIAIAWHCAYLGQKEKTIRYLKKAYDEHSPDTVLIVDRRFSSLLRSDPRFSDLLKRVGLPE